MAYLFAFALMVAGQSSAMAGGVAGIAIFNGQFKLAGTSKDAKSWGSQGGRMLVLRLLTRLLVIGPCLVLIGLFKVSAEALMTGSQVILALHLPLALLPLLCLMPKTIYTRHRERMWLAWTVTVVVILANASLLLLHYWFPS